MNFGFGKLGIKSSFTVAFDVYGFKQQSAEKERVFNIYKYNIVNELCQALKYSHTGVNYIVV